MSENEKKANVDADANANPKAEKKTIRFEDLGLSQKVLAAIKKKGFEEPSPIQALTIPVMLRHDTDIIAQAQTGTGKTASFGLPLIEMIDPDEKTVQALILAPTRELAIQVSEEINSLKGDTGIKVTPIYGGQSIDQQLRRLKKGVHIVVGTPGRVIDHLKRRTLKVQNIQHLILDEADEMLNMGFVEDIEEIMSHTNPDKKTLLFSATMPQRIKQLASKYMPNYEFLKVAKVEITANLTNQIYYEVRYSDKFEALCRIIDFEEDFYGLVFCRTKNDVDTIVAHLNDRGYDADAIHGDIAQAQREKTLKRFKDKKINILVATDVAARGIDVNNLTHVINHSIPQDPESYVHRIGRTGRAGNQGTAINLITPSEYRKLMFIQRVSKSDIKKGKLPNVKDIVAAKKRKINEDISAIDASKIDKSYINWAEKLINEKDPATVLAGILHYHFKEVLDHDSYNKISENNGRRRDDRGRDGGRDRGRSRRDDRPGRRENGRRRDDRGGRRDDRGGRRSRRDEGIEMNGQTRLFIAKGKKDSMTKPKIVKFLSDKTGVKGHLIDGVEVFDNFSFVNVPFVEAEVLLRAFNRKSKNEKSLVVRAKSRD